MKMKAICKLATLLGAVGLVLAVACKRETVADDPAVVPAGDSITVVEDSEGLLTVTIKGASYRMRPVAGGTFTMGAPAEDSDADEWEKPAHEVTLSSYYMGTTEVTQALWKAVMGSNPSYFEGDNLPVEKVSWSDCQEFVAKLNQMTGKQFRLPTEAEWEYAARGGNQSKGYIYSGSNDIDAVAWYAEDFLDLGNTHPVGTKQPNELGLYDMSGNVFEWCADWSGDYSSEAQTSPTGPASGSTRMIRGGSWCDVAGFCRSLYRCDSSPDNRNNTIGLRLALTE